MRKGLVWVFLALVLMALGFAQAEETISVCGVEVPAQAESVDLSGIKKVKLSQFMQELDQLPNLKRVDMWDANLSKEERLTLRERYPEVFFGWTIHVNQLHVVRTDATAFSTLGKQPLLNKQNMVNLTMCPDLLALDVGHCLIQDISFMRDMPKLKVLILADAGIKDISPLEDQTEVEYLELFLNNIKDISPLANMTKLRDVNLAFNQITDLSPLYHLPNLERVWLMSNPGLKDEEVERLRQHQPDCEIVTYSWGATGNQMEKRGGQLVQFPGTSWRDHPHYDTIYYIFNGGEYIGWDDPIPENWQKK